MQRQKLSDTKSLSVIISSLESVSLNKIRVYITVVGIKKKNWNVSRDTFNATRGSIYNKERGRNTTV